MMTRKSKHVRKHREDYYILAHVHRRKDGVPDKELSDLMGWDWENNGNRRIKERTEDRLNGWVIRKRVDGVLRTFPQFTDLRKAQQEWRQRFGGLA